MVSTKACVCACLCACVWKPEQTLNVLLDCSPSYVLRQGLSINLHLTDWLSWLANQLWGFASSVLPPCLPLSGYSSVSMPGFYVEPKICTEVLLLVWQAYLSLNHFISPSINIL